MAAPVAGHVWFSDDGTDQITKGGIWMSIDGGVTMQRLGSIRGVRQIGFGKPETGSGYAYTVFMNGLYNGTKGIYRSDDYGQTWTRLEDAPTCCTIESLCGDRQVYGRVFIGTGGRGVFQGGL